MKFIKEPTTVQAHQFDGTLEFPEWIKAHWKLDGDMLIVAGNVVNKGDYILNNPDFPDDVYPAPKAVFESTYAPITDNYKPVQPLNRNDNRQNQYTQVWAETEFDNNAPHYYTITDIDGINELSTLYFQNGPIKEIGVNGIHHEDLIDIIIDRLEHFQRSPYSCRENALAITKLEEAQMWLNKRTNARLARGVEGTHKV
ncbi:MAG: hypothetical protein LBV67_07450 [Streptococcaceae bacterium]|jgi:hypothetical protein|nr:hypothetical protein [Streptococcaceae bacterium]